MAGASSGRRGRRSLCAVSARRTVCDRVGSSQDYGQAVAWFRRAAAQGLAEAEFALGLMYRHGRGVRQDEAEAARWYRRAAVQGHGEAQVNLGLLYEAGLGVRQDYLEAARWYRKALECGSAPSRAAAAVHLGVLYGEGLGVERDDAAAVEWFKQAAAAGEPSRPVQPGADVPRRPGHGEGRCPGLQVVALERRARAGRCPMDDRSRASRTGRGHESGRDRRGAPPGSRMGGGLRFAAPAARLKACGEAPLQARESRSRSGGCHEGQRDHDDGTRSVPS